MKPVFKSNLNKGGALQDKGSTILSSLIKLINKKLKQEGE